MGVEQSETTVLSEGGQEATPGQNTQPSFRDTLSDGFKNKYTEFKTVEDVFKGYDGLVKKLGKNPLVPPAEDASEEEKQAYQSELRRAVGVPEDYTAYEVNLGDDLPQEITSLFTEKRLEPYKKAALEGGVTKEGFGKLMEVYKDEIRDTLKQASGLETQSYEQAVNQLKEEWGKDYDKNVQNANGLLKSVLSKDQGQALVDKYGNDPVIIKAFAEIASRNGEEYQGKDVSGSQDSVESLRIRAKELNSKAFDVKLKPEERSAAANEARKLYLQIDKMQGSQ